jgi:hypothetical protein
MPKPKPAAPALNRAQCKDCGRDVIWARTEGGENVCLTPTRMQVFGVRIDQHGRTICDLKGEQYVRHIAYCKALLARSPLDLQVLDGGKEA